VSTLLRSTNALMVAPLLVGALVRRERGSTQLVLGAILGGAARLLVAHFLLGDALYLETNRMGWSVAAVPSNLPFCAGTLLVLVPFGLASVFACRDVRRPEIVATTLIVLLFFSFYEYNGSSSGWLGRLILGPRFFLPLVPLLAITVAEFFSRKGTTAGSEARWRTFVRQAAPAAIAVAAFGVHPAMASRTDNDADLRREIYAATDSTGVTVVDRPEARKYLTGEIGGRRTVSLARLRPAQLPALVERDGTAFLVTIERYDAEYHHRHRELQERWRNEAKVFCIFETLHDGLHGRVRLRVERTRSCHPQPSRQ
jgi:hypothetical protein